MSGHGAGRARRSWFITVVGAVVLALGVRDAFAGHNGRTCSGSYSDRHTACIDVSDSTVAGTLRNDSSREESCGEFRLNLTTYDSDGHQFDHAGDETMNGCLPPGGEWRVTFPYVDPSQTRSSYSSNEPRYYYTLMCVKGFRTDPGGETLITGSACHRFPSTYDH
jgi:hypothetical protein